MIATPSTLVRSAVCGHGHQKIKTRRKQFSQDNLLPVPDSTYIYQHHKISYISIDGDDDPIFFDAQLVCHRSRSDRFDINSSIGSKFNFSQFQAQSFFGLKIRPWHLNRDFVRGRRTGLLLYLGRYIACCFASIITTPPIISICVRFIRNDCSRRLRYGSIASKQ